MVGEDFLPIAASVAEFFRVPAQTYGDDHGFMSFFKFREYVTNRGLVSEEDFAHFMMRMYDEGKSGHAPYVVEFRGPETPTEVATAGRLKPESRLMFWNGKKQVPVMRVKIVDQLSDRLYDPYVNVTWDEVENGDEIFIDNYQRGKFPKASPQISGPYMVVDLASRRLARMQSTSAPFMYYPNNLLKEKE